MARLGYAGLIPFYLFAVFAFSPLSYLQEYAPQSFVVYSLAILSFLAGSLWGSSNVRSGADKIHRLIASNAFTVAGAFAVIMAGPLVAAALLAALHLLLLGYEARSPSAAWYLSMRKRLTWLSMPAYVILAGSQIA